MKSKRPVTSSFWVVGTVIALILLASLVSYGQRGEVEFEQLFIGNMRVEFYQRTIGEAIVEGDFIVRQYDRETGELIEEIIHWRPGLPEELPWVISREEAMSLVGEEVQFTQLYYIADGSAVHPVYTPNPCWIVRTSTRVADDIISLTSTIIDAVTGEILGLGVPPPQYTAFSLTGPQCNAADKACTTCNWSWGAWYQNATNWFNTMGYSTEDVKWPTENKVRSHIQNNNTAVFYELAHGGSTAFASGCVGGTSYEITWATEVHNWISSYPAMRFAFIGSCGGMCNTGSGSFSYEFRKGSSEDVATTGYCGMSGKDCGTDCWDAGHTIAWQTSLFKYMSQGYTVKDAFDKANADRPFCAKHNCMRFAGDPDLMLVPTVSRVQPAGWCSCSWLEIGYDKSHFQIGGWCPAGSYLTQVDLDSDISHGEGNSPIIGRARCCKLCGYEASGWGSCSWHKVGYDKSHFQVGGWCPAGSYITQIDLDGDPSHGPGNSPVVGQVRCCRLPGTQLPNWGASAWVEVGGLQSHNWHLGDWCADGTFLTAFDLDGGPNKDYPIVRGCECTRPSP